MFAFSERHNLTCYVNVIAAPTVGSPIDLGQIKRKLHCFLIATHDHIDSWKKYLMCYFSLFFLLLLLVY